MKTVLVFSFFLLLSFVVGNHILAEESSVNIISPNDGSTLDAMEQHEIKYETKPGPRGDHIHFYVDGDEVAILRQLKGSYTPENLAPGERELCVKVVNKNHTPVGAEDCITITMK